jgi:hypothetical protein
MQLGEPSRYGGGTRELRLRREIEPLRSRAPIIRLCCRSAILLSIFWAFAPRPVSAATRQNSPDSSDTAFVLSKAGVVPENIVYDAPRDKFLGGDLEKDGMVELGRHGAIRPLVVLRLPLGCRL